MKKAAFFDIDGTVFRSSLLIELVERLIYKGVFDPSTRDDYHQEYIAWVNRQGSYEDYIYAVIRSFIKHINGVHYGIFADVGKDVVEEHRSRVYRYTRDLIKQLKEDNYFVVAISQSPKTILDEFCTSYGFDKVYGRLYEIDGNDVLTGGVVDEEIIKDKANIVDRVFENHDVTREGSVGVGDTEGDIPLLSAVEKPICFNPNKLLYEHAKANGWQVVVERKDMIYEL